VSLTRLAWTNFVPTFDLSLMCDTSLLILSSKFIQQELDAGTNIICDRYAFSGAAFTAAKVRQKRSSILTTILADANSMSHRASTMHGANHPTSAFQHQI